MDTKVLVVGAGPTGLFLASELARFGVSVTIIDRDEGPSVHSKALGIHARTLEVFSTRQIADAFVERGLPIQKARLFAGGTERAQLPLGDIDSAYPFILSLPQSETEQLLLNQLHSFNEDVLWNTELLALTSDGDSVIADLDTGNENNQLRASWVIGCDGAHSRVRREMRIGWQGEDINTPLALMDARIESDVIDAESFQVFLLNDSRVILFVPLPDGRQRVILTLAQPRDETALDPAFFQRQLTNHVDGALTLRDVDWISTFSVRQRVADTFRRGRVFLAGDAAHAHSPAGGQGMNTGLQDAHNLAWKLATVLNGNANEHLLDTYDAERRPIAEAVVRLTGLGTRFVGPLPWWKRALRNCAVTILPRIGPIRRRLLKTISQVNVNYADGPLTKNGLGHHTDRLRAGHFAPNLVLADESLLYSHLASGIPLALVSSAVAPPTSLAESTLSIQEVPASTLEAHDLPRRAVLIVRPDGYVGYTGTVDGDTLASYLTRHGLKRDLSAHPD